VNDHLDLAAELLADASDDDFDMDVRHLCALASIASSCLVIASKFELLVSAAGAFAAALEPFTEDDEDDE